MLKSTIISLFLGSSIYSMGAIVDVFITGGQSNSTWDGFAWSNAIRAEITASNQYSNPVVLSTGHNGNPLNNWYDTAPTANYEEDFFNSSGTGVLQSKISEIEAAGDTARVLGLYWFQGESDDQAILGGSLALYPSRWASLISQLDTDIGHSNWNYLMNRVKDFNGINAVLQGITDADSRGVLFDSRQDIYVELPNNLHGYDHALVGTDNVGLFNATFPVPEPSSVSLLGLGLFGLCVHRKKN